MSALGVLRIIGGYQRGFWCPGCRGMHAVYVAPAPSPWGFNGNYDRPTFTPSIKVTGRDFTPKGREQYAAWCAAGFPQGWPPFEAAATCCHSFVTDGQIQFLPDCTHSLAGKTVPLTIPDL